LALFQCEIFRGLRCSDRRFFNETEWFTGSKLNYVENIFEKSWSTITSDVSLRHSPDEVYAVDAIPMTITG